MIGAQSRKQESQLPEADLTIASDNLGSVSMQGSSNFGKKVVGHEIQNEDDCVFLPQSKHLVHGISSAG
jgi:hypothetical protein